MDTGRWRWIQRSGEGAPPDGFLIDGHESSRLCVAPQVLAHRLTGFSSMDTAVTIPVALLVEGAPPDGFLIDGHDNTAAHPSPNQPAHRLTGFSSMDTELAEELAGRIADGAPPDGFLIDGHSRRTIAALPLRQGAPPDGFLIDGHQAWGTEGHRLLGAPPDGFLIDGHGLLCVISPSGSRRTA